MTKKIRVGFDVTPLYSGHKIRGIGFYTSRLINELKKFNYLEIVEIKNENDKEQKLDLLHIPYFSPFQITLPMTKNFPLVVTIHDLIPLKYPDKYPPGIRGKLKFKLQKALIKNADLIITDSKASKKDIVSLLGIPKNKIEVIYLAPDQNHQPLKTKDGWNKEKISQLRDKYQLPKKFVLYVGDVNFNKNIPSLIKTCKIIKKPLVIVGKQAAVPPQDPKHIENSDLVLLQDQAKKYKSSGKSDKFSITLTGFVSDEELTQIYNLASVYCQPSIDEGFGLPVLEAMACGCPVVCSDRGSLPEVAGKAAYLSTPEPKDLAKAIKKVLANKKLALKLRKKGLIRSKKFTWKKTAKQTLKSYKKTILNSPKIY